MAARWARSATNRLDHVAKNDATRIFTLFRDWLARQSTALGFEADADALALHILMLSQGAATLATAFRDEDFIRREVEDVDNWLNVQCSSGSPFSQPVSHQPA